MAERWQNDILMAIPSINGGRLLARMLPTLRFKPENVVVLDQGSTDETEAVCADAGVVFVQLGHPRTYTEACNIGARIARERGCSYLCVSNNDIVFRTDVLGELAAAMERDPMLAIVAPSQVIIDEARDQQVTAYRVFWNLDTVDFLHDPRPPGSAVSRLESDFCELTCALVRMSAIEAVGFLDDDYGFYFEDADFGFRLRKAGYSCAYVPTAQIAHYESSTINRDKSTRKDDYIAKNKRLFTQKHLGYGVFHELDEGRLDSEQDVLDRNIHPYIWRYGMWHREAPELVISYPGAATSSYLLTTFETTRIPDRWLQYDRKYRAIMTTSLRMQDLLLSAGIANVFHVPFGVEPDVFNPWQPSARLYEETTYLAIVDGGQHRLLRMVLQAWHRFADPGRKARLILVGRDLGGCLGHAADGTRRSGSLDIEYYAAERIDVCTVAAPMSDLDRAQLYRNADYTIIAKIGEGSNTAALESLACGVPCIFRADAPGSERVRTDGVLAEATLGDLALADRPASFSPLEHDADLPVDGLVLLLEQSHGNSGREQAVMADEAMIGVRTHATLRHTIMGLYAVLTQLQEQDVARIIKKLPSRPGPVSRDECPTIAEDHETASGDVGQPERASPPAIRMGSRVGRLTARRLKTVGHLATRFGSVWEAQSFAAAGGATMRELGYFIAHRSRQLSRLGAERSRQTLVEPGTEVAAQTAPAPRSALLIGYIDAELGLGQSLRGLALAMSTSNVSFAVYPFGVGVERRRSGAYMRERYDTNNPHAVNIIEVAPDELPTVFRHVSPQHLDRSYNILRTYWELGKAPEAWRPHLALVDEIWAPTKFVAASLRTVSDRPITIVPPCVQVAPPAGGGHRHFGLEEGCFYFLFSFDYYSFPQRKNPLGVLRAFRAAFPDPSMRVGLIIKSSGLINHFPRLKQQLRSAANQDARIEIIDESLSRQDMLQLMATADCYVSLHRSEGFGLGMAEAMTLGKPVIATDYSGNTDFLMEATGYPVPYVLRPVQRDEYIHVDDQVWAEPDEAACAEAMRRVFTNRAEAAAKAEAGRRFVAEHHGAVAIGRIVERRLNEIFDRAAAPQSS
jgi:GT2 family glycosyltransferase